MTPPADAPRPHELVFYPTDDGDRPPHDYVVLVCRCEDDRSEWNRWKYRLDDHESLIDVIRQCGEHGADLLAAIEHGAL